MSTARLPRTAVVSVLLAACGTGPAPQTNANIRSNDSANIAQRATDPRSADPTAAGPGPMAPTPGRFASLMPSATASSSAAPAAGDPRPGEPPGAASGKRADPPRKVAARHVLIQWIGTVKAPTNVVRSREQAQSVAVEVLRRARAGDDFARLAIEYSDEPGAGARGGSLGRFARGQMDAAFETAVYKLEVGQISDIVESPFGFHVIQRTE